MARQEGQLMTAQGHFAIVAHLMRRSFFIGASDFISPNSDLPEALAQFQGGKQWKFVL